MKNPDSKVAFATQSYVSTFIAQFTDNLVFALLVTLENDYGKRIDIAELSKYETVGDLAHLALSA